MAKKDVRAAARKRLVASDVAAEAEVSASSQAPAAKASATYAEVPLEAVAPNRANPRKDVGDLDELVASIREVGVLQPIVVRPLVSGEAEHYPEGTRYVLVMGERRWTASGKAGAKTVPALVRTDAKFVEGERQKMLIENLHRRELSAVEEATAYSELVQEGLSQRAVAQQVGKTQAHVSRRLSLLQMDPQLVTWVTEGRLTVDAATKKIVPEIDRAHQGAVAEYMATVAEREDREPDAEFTLADVSRAVSHVAARQRREAEEARQVALIEEIGTVVQNPDDVDGPLLVAVGEELAREKAAAGVSVYGVVDPYGTGPCWYVPVDEDELDEAQAVPSQPPAKPVEDAEARERRRWKEIREGVAAWVAVEIEHRPRKTELADKLAAHVVGTASHDHLQMVQKWMQAAEVGPEKDHPWYWQTAVLESDPSVILTAAWLITVAADTYGARNATADSEVAKVTAARIAAAKGEQA